MKKAWMNISHSRFILSKLKIFGEIVSTFTNMVAKPNILNSSTNVVVKINTRVFKI